MKITQPMLDTAAAAVFVGCSVMAYLCFREARRIWKGEK